MNRFVTKTFDINKLRRLNVNYSRSWNVQKLSSDVTLHAFGLRNNSQAAAGLE